MYGLSGYLRVRENIEPSGITDSIGLPDITLFLGVG